MSVMIHRHLTTALTEALSDTPVILLQGARQTGKSTLVQWLAVKHLKSRYFSLDDAAVLAAATNDPAAFLAGIEGSAVLDEVQLAPGLFRAMKLEVDRRRTPGRFLLTGSTNVLLLPKLSESLAGRMEILNLHPLSQGEIAGTQEGFVDAMFHEGNPGELPSAKVKRRELIERVLAGGYPEVVRRPTPQRRDAWFGSYLTTILQRDIRELSDIEGLTQVPRLLTLLATQAGGLLNIAELSRDIGLAQTTVKRYLSLLQATFLYHPLPAWAGNPRKRLIKRAKAYLCDTGLLAYLLRTDVSKLQEPSPPLGPLLESFVFQELLKQSAWSKARPSLYYYRTASGQEVDFVLEDRAGRVVGIEVKATSNLGTNDFKGLKDLEETVGKRFLRGIILYGGQHPLAFAKNALAMPIESLWTLT